jgi:hypothetical protein
MAWRNEQAQRRKFLTQPQKNLSKNFLFSAMSAAAEEDWALLIEDIQMGRSDALNVHTIIETDEIVFDAASVADPGVLHPEPMPSMNVLRLLHANQIEKPKCWRDKKSKSPKSSLRSQR